MAKYDRYAAKAIKGEFGESKKKGTQYVEVLFEVVEGEAKGRTFPWQGYFTEGTSDRTVQSLRLAGCTFPGDDITNLAGLGSKTVDIQVEPTDFGPRVAWVNESGASSINEENKMGTAAKKALAAKMKGTLLAVKGGLSAKPRTAAPVVGGSDPFAVNTDAQSEAPANEAAPANDTPAGEELPATGTDDNIPF